MAGGWVRAADYGGLSQNTGANRNNHSAGNSAGVPHLLVTSSPLSTVRSPSCIVICCGPCVYVPRRWRSWRNKIANKRTSLLSPKLGMSRVGRPADRSSFNQYLPFLLILLFHLHYHGILLPRPGLSDWLDGLTRHSNGLLSPVWVYWIRLIVIGLSFDILGYYGFKIAGTTRKLHCFTNQTVITADSP